MKFQRVKEKSLTQISRYRKTWHIGLAVASQGFVLLWPLLSLVISQRGNDDHEEAQSLLGGWEAWLNFSTKDRDAEWRSLFSARMISLQNKIQTLSKTVFFWVGGVSTYMSSSLSTAPPTQRLSYPKFCSGEICEWHVNNGTMGANSLDTWSTMVYKINNKTGLAFGASFLSSP